MSKKIETSPFLTRPLGVDWCHCVGRCPYHNPGGKCGIKERIKGSGRRTMQLEEATRLWEIAQTDPQRFFEICVNFLFR